MVQPSAAVAMATTAAAVKAAVNPEVLSVPPEAADPLTAIPMAVKTAVPSAAPTWVAEPASPDARPVCVSGTEEAMTMVVGVKLSATPTATRSNPGRTATGYPAPWGP